jgi:hypothetical protein
MSRRVVRRETRVCQRRSRIIMRLEGRVLKLLRSEKVLITWIFHLKARKWLEKLKVQMFIQILLDRSKESAHKEIEALVGGISRLFHLIVRIIQSLKNMTS